MSGKPKAFLSSCLATSRNNLDKALTKQENVSIVPPLLISKGYCKERNSKNNNTPAFLNRPRQTTCKKKKNCDYAGQHIFALCADLQKTDQKHRIHINIYINN